MTDFSAFVEQYGFQPADNGYAGKYADMCLTVAEIGGQLDARLYLDLPKGGRRAELLNAIREKTARYGSEMGESENPYVLRFTFSNDGTAISRMERFLNECDVLFRPYGREMGILCARCRREIKEGDSFVFHVEDGAALPVCGDCQNGNVGRAENRTTIRKKRVRRGVLGALVLAVVFAGVVLAVVVFAGVVFAVVVLAVAVFAVVVFAGVLAAAVLVPPMGAFSSDAWVTPVALAICFSAACVSSFSPRSALLMSDETTPTSIASFSWVSLAAVRASLISSPLVFSAMFNVSLQTVFFLLYRILLLF